jgi:hypothetical protein
MKKLVLLPMAAALLVAAGCRDAQVDRVPTANAAAAVKASLSVAGESEAAPRSTVCVAYDNELVRVQAQLAESPDDAELQQGFADVKSLLASSCDTAE